MTPVHPSAGTTVNVAELPASIQSRSGHLQDEAIKALARRDYDTADKLFKEAFQLTPSSPSIANNLGILALRHKDLDSATSWFRKAAEEAPQKPDIVGNLGLVLWMQHRSEESYAILAKATSQGFESGLAHYILGMLELGKGNAQGAMNHLKKAPSDRFPYRDLFLSIALRNCGKSKAADESYRNFVRRNPAPLLADKNL
jgi:tetratricopeptide (TPR) repeat protein